MSGWATEICEANGMGLHYIRTGGDKPPIVLLHGLTLNGACWTPLARALEKDYDVIMPDARGHGKSAIPTSGYLYRDLAADVMGLLDALNLDSPVLLGHSMGGMTAALAASQNPKRFRGLILADPTFLPLKRQWEVYNSDVVEQHRRILSQPKEHLLIEMKNRHTRRSDEIIEFIVQARFQTDIRAFEILTPPNPIYLELINTITIPCLLVMGDRGSVVDFEMAAQLSKLNQQLEVVQIKEAGHGLPYDQAEKFSDVVLTFLSTLSNKN
ncbi:MAG: alpha/beta hydrolase [Candidatus Protochlamydia sp.]|nr:alpha/beta hydrolase [Candidatus Protochlamydia sp.]